MTPSSFNNLTDAEINERIAEACGATWSEDKFGNPMLLKDNLVLLIRTTEVGKFGGMDIVFHLPDYLHDLNAMHEAEMTVMGSCENNSFPFAFAGKYVKALQKVVGGVPGCFDHHCASARQRAEAFLATIAP